DGFLCIKIAQRGVRESRWLGGRRSIFTSKTGSTMDRDFHVEQLERRRFLSGVIATAAATAPRSTTVAINAATTYQTMVGMGAAMINNYTPKEYTDPAFFDRLVNDLGATAARVAIPPTFEKSNDNSDPSTFNWS